MSSAKRNIIEVKTISFVLFDFIVKLWWSHIRYKLYKQKNDEKNVKNVKINAYIFWISVKTSRQTWHRTQPYRSFNFSAVIISVSLLFGINDAVIDKTSMLSAVVATIHINQITAIANELIVQNWRELCACAKNELITPGTQLITHKIVNGPNRIEIWKKKVRCRTNELCYIQSSWAVRVTIEQ